MAIQFNFEIDQGSTFERIFNMRDGDDEIVDLTGCTARMQLRTSVTAGSATLELTTANGRITIDGELGKITLYLTDTVTAALAAADYVYDLELIWPAVGDDDPDVDRLLKGTVTVVAEVTR